MMTKAFLNKVILFIVIGIILHATLEFMTIILDILKVQGNWMYTFILLLIYMIIGTISSVYIFLYFKKKNFVALTMLVIILTLSSLVFSSFYILYGYRERFLFTEGQYEWMWVYGIYYSILMIVYGVVLIAVRKHRMILHVYGVLIVLSHGYSLILNYNVITDNQKFLFMIPNAIHVFTTILSIALPGVLIIELVNERRKLKNETTELIDI